MTNETKEPERIWVEAQHTRGEDIEYTRADLSDAKDKRIEEVTKQRDHALKIIGQQEKRLKARIDELEAQNRELHMQVIASDSQAQMAYEEQEKLEAKLDVAALYIGDLSNGKHLHQGTPHDASQWVIDRSRATLKELKGTD